MVIDALRKLFSQNRFSLAVLLFLLLCQEVFGAPSATATLDRNNIGLGESANLTLTFTEASPSSVPTIPPIPNLNVAYVGQSSRVQIINGVSSSTLSHNFRVTPSAIGNFVIPSVRVNAGGQILTTRPLQLKVTQGAALAPGEKGPAFLKLILPKAEVYVGEAIVVEVQLFCQAATDLNAPQLASEGFTVGQIPQPSQAQTRIGNEIYNVVTFKMPVAATKAGSLTLGPATLSLTLLSGPRDFFGQFTQARAATLKSETQTLRVLPLPAADKPASFNGAIGNFSMAFNASPTNVAVGDPITMKVRISGRGALDSLSLPLQTEWREFKTYPATSKVESNDPLGFEGTKTFDQVVVPENSAIKELPSFEFSFFDPAQKAYRTLTHPAIPLTVRPAAAMPQPAVFSNNTEAKSEEPSREIIHIKAEMGTITSEAPPLVQQPWFWMMQSMPPLLWIASILARKRRENLRNNPHLRREREVQQIVSRGLNDLSKRATAKESDQFFATVFRLLQEQIGERLDLPASAITESVIDDQLRPKGASPTTLELIHELFQACNQARYASQRTSQELASFIPKVEQAIAELRRLK